jgi:hypothetical protein
MGYAFVSHCVTGLDVWKARIAADLVEHLATELTADMGAEWADLRGAAGPTPTLAHAELKAFVMLVVGGRRRQGSGRFRCSSLAAATLQGSSIGCRV